MKRQINWTVLKLRSFIHKHTSEKGKRQAREWEKTLVLRIPAKELGSRLYQELLELVRKDNPREKRTKDLIRHFIRGYTLKEIKIKAPLYYQYIPE